MNMIYNSPHFCVVEFTEYGASGKHASGGFEIMDKSMLREIFLCGEEAERCRGQVA